MLNTFLYLSFIWFITVCILFYVNWNFYQGDDKTFKNIIRYMHCAEFLPIINTAMLIVIVLFFVMIIGSVYIVEIFKKIKNKFLRK